VKDIRNPNNDHDAPGFVNAKKSFLPKAHTLARLPPGVESDMTDEACLYTGATGWSHGKEKTNRTWPRDPFISIVSQTIREQSMIALHTH
jgi:hypothetical protein